MKTVLLLEKDLMFGTRLEKGLEKLGCTVKTVTSEAQLEECLGKAAPALAALNFAGKNPDPFEATRKLRAAFPGLPLLGYYSHTKIPEIRAEAKAAGLTLLVPNSVISTRLTPLIERLLPESGTSPDLAGAEQIAEEDT